MSFIDNKTRVKIVCVILVPLLLCVLIGMKLIMIYADKTSWRYPINIMLCAFMVLVLICLILKFTLSSNIKRIFHFSSKKSVTHGDYSNFNFEDFNLNNTIFTRHSKLPENYGFFQAIRNKTAFNTKLTENCIKNIHLYDLDGVMINLNNCKWYTEILTTNQIEIIKNKYKNQIGKNIILPKTNNILDLYSTVEEINPLSLIAFAIFNIVAVFVLVFLEKILNM